MTGHTTALSPVTTTRAEAAFRWMLVVALVLASVMAFVSNTKERIHPDELDHIAAARYYERNWLPPAIGDPRTIESYSVYGMSYLNEWDVVYAIAGKFAALARPLVHDESYAYRLFDLCLFGILAFLAWRKREAMLLFSVLLVSAQIWYVFSYFNADAFPLFLSILAAYELASPRSAFNDQSRSLALRYLRLGVYLGLLVLSKKTFWMFVVFGAVCAAVLEARRFERVSVSGWLKRMTVLAAMCGAIVVPRIAYDLYTNGLPAEKDQKAIAMASQLAHDAFKPGHAPNEYSKGVALRDQGWSLPAMIRWKGWVEYSIMSSLGVYHHMALYAPTVFYIIAGLCLGLFLLTPFATLVFAGDLDARIITSVAAACCLGIVALSLYHSWVSDFQPQGRYLFAIFAIVGAAFMVARRYVNLSLAHALVCANFVLSVYSFAFVGIKEIPKEWEQVQVPDHPLFHWRTKPSN